MGTPSQAKPLLPDHPPLLSRQPNGERTVYVSPELPPGMERSGGQWSLADFQLSKQLYKGKASTLYQATDRVSGEVVALKTYSKRRLSDLNWYQVEREIRLHGQLRHPNIIQLHAAFEDDTHVFMVCEYAAGGDLYEDLKRAGGRLKERVVAGEVLPPFMDALAHMHARSIVHRDIKPENILLGGGRAVKVADFGLSINWGEERPVTRAGTLDYMSPEVLQCPEKSRPEENKERLELGYSDAVDVWAVGILAYELLVGRPPFERESREETQQYIQRREPALPEGVSEAARGFILAALAKNPRKRPAMEDLLRHPWIQQHARRPSTTTPTRTSDFRLPLQQLASPALPEADRRSLHGAKSVRDFSALLSAPTVFSHTLAAALHPALSIASSLLPTASTAAADAAAAVRPTTTHSRLGAAALRPDTPAVLSPSSPAAQMVADLPAPAFPVAGEQGTEAGSSSWGQAAGAEAEQQPWHARASGWAGGASTAGSLRLPTSTAGTARDASFASALSSTSAAVEPSASSLSFTHSAAAHKLRTSSYNLQQAAAAEQQSAFLELYKSMAPLPAAAGSERTAGNHTPRAPPLGRKATGSHPAAATRSSSNKALDAAGLPPLQQQQQQQQQHEAGGAVPPATALGRLPSLHRVLSQPARHVEAAPAVASPDEEGGPAAAAPEVVPAEGAGTTAAPADSELAAAREQQQHAELASIPEQASGEAEAGNPVGRSSQSDAGDGGHIVLEVVALHKGQQAAAAEDDAPPRIAAVYSLPAASVCGSGADPAEHGRQLHHGLEPEPSMRTAQLTAHDRMREAEQRHVEKLRARASAASPPPDASAASRQQPRQLAGSSYGAGIAKSASSLLNKLLGRRPGPAGDGAAAGGRVVERSGSSGTAASQGPEGQVKHSKYRLSPPSVHMSVRAGGGVTQPPSPRQQPAEPHRSGGGLVHRRAPPAASRGLPPSSPAGSAATLRTPVPRRAVPGRAVPAHHAAAAAAAQAEAEALPAMRQRTASRPSGEGVEHSSNSKSVRFAALGRSGPSANLDGQGDGDLIPAFHSQGASMSFSSAVSSLPSLTAQRSGSTTSPRVSRKGSMSPGASRKSSHLAPMPSRSSVGRAAAGAGLHGASRHRGSKVASMPGDAGGGPAADHAAAMRQEGSSEEGGGMDAVQRSAASWSAGAGRKGAAAQRKSSATAARLSMYRQMMDVGGRTSPDSHGGSPHRSPPATAASH